MTKGNRPSKGLARLGEPLQYRVTEHQIEGAGHLVLEILNGAMDETNSVFQALLGDLLPARSSISADKSHSST